MILQFLVTLAQIATSIELELITSWPWNRDHPAGMTVRLNLQERDEKLRMRKIVFKLVILDTVDLELKIQPDFQLLKLTFRLIEFHYSSKIPIRA